MFFSTNQNSADLEKDKVCNGYVTPGDSDLHTSHRLPFKGSPWNSNHGVKQQFQRMNATMF